MGDVVASVRTPIPAPTVVVALVAVNGRTGSLADADSSPHIFVARIVDNQRVRVFVSNAGIEVLEADVSLR